MTTVSESKKGLSFTEYDEAIKIEHAQKINILPQLDFDNDLFCVFNTMSDTFTEQLNTEKAS